ncbi:MAG: hypothetical protein E7315_05550 [Clostridiales bacterium]|nr:hypothetical protein [Clostridiales bacterium]
MKRKIIFCIVFVILILCTAGCTGPTVTPSATPDALTSLPESIMGFWQEADGDKYVGVSTAEDGENTVFIHGEWGEGILIAGKITHVTVTEESVYGFNVFSTENGDTEYSIGIRAEITDEEKTIYVKAAEYGNEAKYIFAGATYDDALEFYNGMNSDTDNGGENNGNGGNPDNGTVNIPNEIKGWWQGEEAGFISFEYINDEWIYTEGIWDSDFERSYKVVGIYSEGDTVLRLEAEILGGYTTDGQCVIYVDTEGVSQGIIEIKASDSIVFSKYKYSGKTEDEAYGFYEDSVNVSAVFPGVLLG